MKCKACGKKFKPKSKDLYLATETLTPLSSLTTVADVLECFDCPSCGCQNVVGKRYDKIENNT